MQGESFGAFEGGDWRAAPIAYEGRQAIEVQMPPQPLADWGPGLRSLTLNGGGTLESNGTEVERGAPKWCNLSKGV